MEINTKLLSANIDDEKFKNIQDQNLLLFSTFETRGKCTAHSSEERLSFYNYSLIIVAINWAISSVVYVCTSSCFEPSE